MSAVFYLQVNVKMRHVRGYTVWALLILHPLAAFTGPADTVLCRTASGSAKVEIAINGVCSGESHEARGKTTPQSTDGRDSICSCHGSGHHGPCNDTLLSVYREVLCPQSLPVQADNVIDYVSNDSDCGALVEAPPAIAESIDPPWQQPGLELLRTVRLLT